MPTYEYACQNYGIRFDRFQRMSDAPMRICPECGGAVERLIGAGSGVISKRGAAFYAKGYKGPQPDCGRDAPCRGRDTRCDRRPCDHSEA